MNETIRPEINLSNEVNDFSSWFQEKSFKILRNLSRAVDCINLIENGETEDIDFSKEEMEGYLHYIAVDSIRLVAVIYGVESFSGLGEADTITNKGYEGFKQLMEKFGIDYNSSDQFLNEQDAKTRNEIRKLITFSVNNRTKIYSYIDTIHFKNSNDIYFQDELEKVTMGELTWKEFVEKFIEIYSSSGN